jgi:hypothetical protein
MANLSPAATLVLQRAAARGDWRLEFSRKLPAPARHKMINALALDGLVMTTTDDESAPAAENMVLVDYALTLDGFRAIGIEPGAPATREQDEAAQDAAMAPQSHQNAAPEPQQSEAPTARTGLRAAAEAALKVWHAYQDGQHDAQKAQKAMDNLRVALAPKATVTTPRAGTKKELVVDMLKRDTGTTLAEIMEATGWQKHTAGAFISIQQSQNGAEIVKTKTAEGINYRWTA